MQMALINGLIKRQYFHIADSSWQRNLFKLIDIHYIFFVSGTAELDSTVNLMCIKKYVRAKISEREKHL